MSESRSRTENLAASTEYTGFDQAVCTERNAPLNIWIVIPAYNEEQVVGQVVREVCSGYKNIVVVDDCSNDATAGQATNAGATVLRHPVNLGQGAALQTGISYALRQSATHIVTFDADGQHRVTDIAGLLSTLRSTDADVVLGSRFLGRAENLPRLRRIVLRTAAFYMRVTTGLPLTDAHNGLRIFTSRAAEKLEITQNRMAHASEIIHQIAAAGLKVVEAPVTIVYTAYSLQKGQKLSNSVDIVFELLVGRFSR